MKDKSLNLDISGKNVVATTQPLAAQTGLKMIAMGGNAADAAIATAITLTVVEPTMNGIGSDAFCLIWDSKKLHGLNASGKFPRGWQFEDFAHYQEMPTEGWQSVTVPGAVSAWVELSAKFGKLPFERLFENAIRIAKDGFKVTPVISDQWRKQLPRFSAFTEFNKVFTQNGKTPDSGALYKFPDHARTLESIRDTRGHSFYQGNLAEKMVEHSTNCGGKLCLDDLASHSSQWVDPIQTVYRDIEIHELPPNTQGLGTSLALSIIDKFEEQITTLSKAKKVHLEIEATKLALIEIYRELSDPNFMNVSVEELLSEDHIQKLVKKLSLERTLDVNPPATNSSETVYLTAADSEGMMVSFIQSNYMGFGSGVVVPKTGISLQNRGAGFIIEKDHPNCVQGNKLPFHTIIPGFITQSGAALSSFGLMGGDMQAQGHVQLTRALIRDNLSPQEAIDMPRWKIRKDGKILIENGMEREVLETLAKLGHPLVEVPYGTYDFGASQVIVRDHEQYLAGSESRRDGIAVSF